MDKLNINEELLERLRTIDRERNALGIEMVVEMQQAFNEIILHVVRQLLGREPNIQDLTKVQIFSHLYGLTEKQYIAFDGMKLGVLHTHFEGHEGESYYEFIPLDPPDFLAPAITPDGKKVTFWFIYS